MAKKTVTFSIDIEASGPIPGPWWMCSIGICRTDDVSKGFSTKFHPLDIPGMTEPDDPSAMRVVAAGIPEVGWQDSLGPEANIEKLRKHFIEEGRPPLEGLVLLRDWILAEAKGDRAVVIGSPVTYDFLWIYWYWWRFMKEMPVFGFSGLDLRSYFMGMHGVDFLGTGKERYLKHYPNSFAHTHDPLDDARQQGQIWQDMVKARLAQKSSP